VLPYLLAAAASQAKLEVRLETHLTSYSSKPGTPFRCVVIRTFHAGDLTIPQGSIVRGVVRKAQSVGLGFRHERAALELTFMNFETPDGHIWPLDATLSSIDNAREQVNAHGRIKGVLAANNPGNLLNGFWTRPTSNLAFRSLVGLTGVANQVWLKYSMGPMGAAGLFAARCALVKFPEPEIHLPPGTDMHLTVAVPAHKEYAKERGENDKEQPPDAEFARSFSAWVASRLSAINYTSGRTAPDMLNVILFGSRVQVIDAFRVAGWSQADERGWGTSSRVYLAFSAMHSYHSAPVSPLLYRGSLPDLVFEKSFDTVTQRHHIRFWYGGAFRGEDVWLGAATHDSGVTFRLASLSFSHKIDADIDIERQKIRTDLNFAGCSEDPLLMARPIGAQRGESERATTDERILLLTTRFCEASGSTEAAPPPPGTRLSRFTRRMVLETRNYLLRDNIYYWGYRFIRSSRNHVNPLVH
jgi:hypothetical protein